MNIQLKLDDAGWRGFLNTVRNGLGSADSFLKKAFLIIWPKESSDHFRNEMGPEGPWAPWSKSYADYMNRVGLGGNKILQNTGRLRQQTTLDPEMVELPNGLKIVSPTPYSGYLDDPSDESRMPARPFMWMGDDSQERLAKTLLDMLFGKIGGTQ